MTDEPTAWQDINPPMVSARPQGQLSPCSDADARTVFRNELTACLALTAPVGMTEESRREWLAIAWDTLKHLPPDILTVGAIAARRKCDHPSKIVPAIIAETADMVRWHRESELVKQVERLAAPEPNYITPQEAAEIMARYGLKRSDSIVSGNMQAAGE